MAVAFGVVAVAFGVVGVVVFGDLGGLENRSIATSRRVFGDGCGGLDGFVRSENTTVRRLSADRDLDRRCPLASTSSFT